VISCFYDHSESEKRLMAATILIIDRYDVVRTALSQWLKVVFPAIRVTEASNSADALDRINDQAPNIVIVDILLPGSNGVSATQQIRSVLPLVPIVILTMYEDEVYRTEAFKAGANVFIPQREMYQELIPSLRALLAKVEA
jgi:DNA-binding NarL/FixJ family response regulator